jgi:hypothetical protein
MHPLFVCHISEEGCAVDWGGLRLLLLLLLLPPRAVASQMYSANV